MRTNNCHLDKSYLNSQLSISLRGGKRGGGKRGGEERGGERGGEERGGKRGGEERGGREGGKRGGEERGVPSFRFSQDELDFRMFVYVDEKFVNHKQKVNGDRF